MYTADERPADRSVWINTSWKQPGPCPSPMYTYVSHPVNHSGERAGPPWLILEAGDMLINTMDPVPAMSEQMNERLAVLLLVKHQSNGGPYLPGVGYWRNGNWLIVHGGD